MTAGTFLETELGVERVCSACGDAWPYDPEFWYRQPNGYRGLQSMCKACKAERRGGGSGIRRDLDRGRIVMLLRAGLPVGDIAYRLECSEGAVYRVKRSLVSPSSAA